MNIDTNSTKNDVMINFKILQINIRGIQGNYYELRKTLSDLNIDIAFIQET